MPTFASLVSCSDENLAKLGANHVDSEVIREGVGAYDEETEIPQEEDEGYGPDHYHH